MLVLTRKKGEKIKLGDNIVITVCEIQHGRARIGVEAPPEIKVIRDDAKSTKPAAAYKA